MTSTSTSHKPWVTLHTLSPIALALCTFGTGAYAQTTLAPIPVPDAGRVLRDLQPAPVLKAPAAAPLPLVDNSTEPAKDEARALVKSIVITGNQEISTPELQALVASLSGTGQTLSQLNAAARRITAYYRERGFAVARAYLPAQDITSGAVTINVVEGRIASYKLNNQARLSNERTEAFFGQIKDGDVIKSTQIDRGLLLLQDTPGVAGSRATLQPGASIGTSELLIELDPAKAYAASLSLDNYGGRYTGTYRLGGNFTLASPLNIGDQLSFTGLSSGSNLSFGRLAYQLPVGSDGLRLGAAYFSTNYKLGKEFSVLNAHGTANSTSAFAAYPLIRSPLKNLNVTAAYETKRLSDRVDSTATATNKQANITSFGLSGNRQDTLGGGGISSFEINAALGQLSINSPGALAIDAVSARSNGRYSRVAYSMSRLQRLGETTALSVSVTGQQASKNLDSSEKFSLGGANAVRAYPQGEAVGDQGRRATLELQQALAANLQGILFYDVGQVTINKNQFGAAAANSRSLAGAGVGLNANYSSISLRSMLAWRISGGLPTSVPAGNAKTPMLLLQASVAF